MGLSKTIVLVSSGQPSANPRLVKEAISLQKAGCEVTVIYVPISPWADVFDKQLIQSHPQIKFVKTGYHPDHHQWLYKWARFRRKVNSYLTRFIGDTINAADYSTILFGQELLKAAKQHKADLYIAHNLGALPAAVKASCFHKAKVGFDAEDFHRGEFIENSFGKKQAEFIEHKFFPLINYLTVSSPLIGEAYKQIFPELTPIVIKNVFPLSKLKVLPANDESSTLNLFWFSQTIGKKRGIECIIEALGMLRYKPIQLTLLGNVSIEIKKYFLELAYSAGLTQDIIHFVAPVNEKELFKIASKFDIGLSAEVPYCLNREYCLTNKIFTNLIAGNALVLSDTQAQKEFICEHTGVGMLYKQDDPSSLASVLHFYYENKDILLSHQKNARELAEKELNWEIESKKFVNLIHFLFKV